MIHFKIFLKKFIPPQKSFEMKIIENGPKEETNNRLTTYDHSIHSYFSEIRSFQERKS